MISALRIPKLDSVFLSSNNINISVSSDNPEAFVKAYIFVDEVLFTEQIWSKYDSTQIQVNLKNLFTDLFFNDFEPSQIISLNRKDNLIKRIRIELKEIELISELEIDSFTLNDFFVVYSSNDYYFNTSLALVDLSSLSAITRCSPFSILSIPFWVNSDTVEIRILNGINEIYQNQFSSLTKGVYCFNLPLSDLTFSNNQLKIEIVSNGISVNKELDIVSNSYYSVSTLFFKNRIGVYESVDFFGRTQIDDKYKRNTVTDYNDVKHQVSFTKSPIVKIYSGHLLLQQLKQLEELFASNCIQLMYEGNYKPFIPTNTKLKRRDDDVDIYSSFIQLELADNLIQDLDFNYD